jgi:hypothetical protein
MPRKAKQEHVTRRVEEYLQAAFANSGDSHPLDVRSVAAWVPCSPTLIYKYGLDIAIKRAAKRLARGRKDSPLARLKASYEARFRAARQEAAEWKQRYNDTLERLILVEYHLRGHTQIDVDRLYSTPMPVPDRSEPYMPSRRRRDGRRSRLRGGGIAS